MRYALRFGIPQLDELLNSTPINRDGAGVSPDSTSMTILGPDGTGKSVFALHLASTYLSDAARDAVTLIGQSEERAQGPTQGHRESPTELDRLREVEDQHLSRITGKTLPRVVYVSTDLTYSRALSVWKNFWLNYPWSRRIPFDDEGEIRFRRKHKRAPIWIELKQLRPKGEELNAFLEPDLRGNAEPGRAGRERETAELRKFSVGLLDFASETAGDDWDLVLRILAAVPKPSPNCCPNLLILDSVAGFETLVGEVDGFGQRISRRARVAELIRTAGSQWSIVFVVEEPKPGEHHPEEFVTDTVLCLRREGTGEHARRILEIEKARSRAYGLGEHFFEIRDGTGTSTAAWQNPDDPRTSIHPVTVREIGRIWPNTVSTGSVANVNAYVQVFQSLHFRSQTFSKAVSLSRRTESPEIQDVRIGFGIPFLDNLLTADGPRVENGLKPGTVTALIGGEGTHKRFVAEAFLRQGFRSLSDEIKAAKKIADRLVEEVSLDTEKVSKIFAPADTDGTAEAKLKRAIRQSWDEASGRRTLVNDRLIAHRTLFVELCRGEWSLRDIGQSGSEDANNEGPMGLKERMDRYLEPRRPTMEAERALAIVCTLLREASGLFCPGVLVTTEDYTAEQLADGILDLHRKGIEENLCLRDSNLVWKDASPHLSRVLQRVLLVRRVELRDMPTPQLYHAIESTIISTVEAIYPGATHTSATGRLKNAERVRVVIGDLRLFREAFPDMTTDKLFMPTLAFRLRRWEVNTLLVHTDEGRPDRAPSIFDGELRSLVDQRLHTWRISFFGENRVAIAVSPPQFHGAAGIVRELEHKPKTPESPRQLRVNPHFELYSGIEEGKPVAVPLQVLFYQETKAFEEYIQSENALFTRLFSAFSGFGAPVIEVRSTKDYEGLRDYCHLPMDTKLPYSLIFVVDGYWSLSKPALRSQKSYLLDGISPPGVRDGGAYADLIDVFRLYRETRYSQKYTENYLSFIKPKIAPLTKSKFRWLYFRQSKPGAEGLKDPYFYRPRYWADTSDIDRVPFSWDFGFLLCGQQEWTNAAKLELSRLRKKKPDGKPVTVGDVWDSLPRIEAPPVGRGPIPVSPTDPRVRLDGDLCRYDGVKDRDLQSWRYFAEAAQVVATVEERRSGRKVLSFDLAMVAPDSLACLFFEIWASEIVRSINFWEEQSKKLKIYPGGTKKAIDEWVKEAKRQIQWFSTDRFDPAKYRDMSAWLLPGFGEHGETPCAVEQFKKLYKPEGGAFSDGGDRREVYSRIDDDPYKFPGFSLELYMTWLLLLELLPMDQYVDLQGPFLLRTDRQAEFNAVAARHWYKSACMATQQDESVHTGDRAVRTEVPVRLPGHFSVRGDWYLAVAKGSRSSRLADLGLDMLTSRRANRTRLYMGLGLPTRDLAEDEQAACLRTRLSVSTPDAITHVLYEDLAALGAPKGYLTAPSEMQSDATDPDDGADGCPFRWFFRTAFKDYDRQAIMFRRWLGRVLAWTVHYRHDERENWTGGFAGYDELGDRKLKEASDQDRTPCVTNYQSLLYMAQFMDLLVRDLQQCSLQEPD